MDVVRIKVGGYVCMVDLYHQDYHIDISCIKAVLVCLHGWLVPRRQLT